MNSNSDHPSAQEKKTLFWLRSRLAKWETASYWIWGISCFGGLVYMLCLAADLIRGRDESLEAVGIIGVIICAIVGCVVIFPVFLFVYSIIDDIYREKIHPLCDGLGHKWDGCVCTRKWCRNDRHSWKGCYCITPGCTGSRHKIERCKCVSIDCSFTQKHQWEKGFCSECGADRKAPANHDHEWSVWSKAEHKCTQTQTCGICGIQERRALHTFSDWYTDAKNIQKRQCFNCMLEETRILHKATSALYEATNRQVISAESKEHAAEMPNPRPNKTPTYLQELGDELFRKHVIEFSKHHHWIMATLKMVHDDPIRYTSYFHALLNELGGGMRYGITNSPDYKQLNEDFTRIFGELISASDVALRSVGEVVQKALLKTDAKCFKFRKVDDPGWNSWLKNGVW